jgi:hypothetical protein
MRGGWVRMRGFDREARPLKLDCADGERFVHFGIEASSE